MINNRSHMHLRRNFLNLPNSLTIARIGAVPVLIYLLISPGKVMSAVAGVVFILVCITDWLDGYLARRSGTETALGKFLDPLADKLLVTTSLIMLVSLGRVPAWMVALMIAREIAVTGLRAIASNEGIVIAASPIGKFKTVFQIICIVPLIIHYKYFFLDFHESGMLLFILAFILTIWSGIDYFIGFFKASAPDAD